MKALALCLFLSPLGGLAQDTELDSLERHCPCVSRANLKRGLKDKWPAGMNGSVFQLKCDGSSYFFLLPPRSRISGSIFLNAEIRFESKDKILTVGPRWFYVKVSDRENMKYDFETKMWSRDKIPEGALGEERY